MGKLVKISAALAAMACFFAFVGCDDPAAEPTNNENAGTIETYDRNEWQIENGAVVKYLGTATDVTIPNGVTYIMSYAFEECRNLKSLAIPASVMGFGQYTFAWCDLETVNYGGTLAQWCTMDRAVGHPINAKSVKLSDGTDLKSVTTLVIPDGVTHIGSFTFVGYDKLISVTIPASVREIGYYAFDNCNGLTTVHYGGTLTQWCAIDGDANLMWSVTSIKLSDGTDLKSITTLDIPDGVTTIESSAFDSCDRLTNVIIPASVKKIGDNAFSKRNNDGNNNLTVSYGGTLAQWCAIDNDYSLMQREINIKLSDGTDLKSVTSLNIPDSVTHIGECAFYGCDRITSITIPNGVTSIGREAFRYCYSLTSVTIPASVESIGYEAFYGSRNLTTVRYGGTESDWKKIKRGYRNEGDELRGKTITGSDGSTWVAE